jgi:hypothetical protein
MRTRSASAEKHSRANQITEVIPTARVGESVDPDIPEPTPDETEQNQETMEKPGEEARRIVGFGSGLGCAPSYHKNYTDEKQEGKKSSLAAPLECSQDFLP